jgi:heme exporter protein CcmD
MIAHAGFIAVAYGIAISVIGGMIGAIVYEHRRLRRELSRFEDRNP